MWSYGPTETNSQNDWNSGRNKDPAKYTSRCSIPLKRTSKRVFRNLLKRRLVRHAGKIERKLTACGIRDIAPQGFTHHGEGHCFPWNL